ncbi:MAG: substrate-binding domain-containing protein [Cellvibrionaceae bacterium]|nr:substrate-binding domain-containing protein [Cellvibrionaceae bacterium]
MANSARQTKSARKTQSARAALGSVLVLSLIVGITHSSFLFAATRENIHVVGSSTVFPLAKVVADRFAKTTKFRGPNIEATGTGGGFKIFCQGLGAAAPDIVNASRRITRSEFDECVRNGVRHIVELPIGYDGVVVVNSLDAPDFTLTQKELFLALAKRVPNPNKASGFIDNPHRYWSDINPLLPKLRIVVYGPPPSSGTRDSLLEMAMEPGCRAFPALASLESSNREQFKKYCHVLRSWPEFVEAGEQDNILIELVVSNPNALGILGFNYLDQNLHRVKSAVVSGVAPTYDNIHDHLYPISRPLYFYIKKAHVGRIPGISQYLAEFISERAWGDEGYLREKGLVPLEPELRKQVTIDFKAMTVLRRSSL